MPVNEFRTREADGSITTSVDWEAPVSNDMFTSTMSEARTRAHEYLTTQKSNEANGIEPATPKEFFDQNSGAYIARTAGLPPGFDNMEQAVAWYRDNHIPTPEVKTFQDANAVARGVAGELGGKVADTRRGMLERGFTGKLPLPGDGDNMEYLDRVLKHKLIEESDPELEPGERVALADQQIESINQDMLVQSIQADLDEQNPAAVPVRGIDNCAVLWDLEPRGPEMDWICQQASDLMEMGHPATVALDAAYQAWQNPSDVYEEEEDWMP